MTLSDVAAGKATGPAPVALAANVSDSPAFAPAATVQVQVYVTGSAALEVVVSALVSAGPVRLEQDAPPVGVTVSALGRTVVTGLSEEKAIVTVTCWPGVATDVETSGSL